MFTFVSRYVAGVFSFDPTMVFFWMVTLAFVLAGCFLTAFIMDALGLSWFIFLRKTLLTPKMNLSPPKADCHLNSRV